MDVFRVAPQVKHRKYLRIDLGRRDLPRRFPPAGVRRGETYLKSRECVLTNEVGAQTIPELLRSSAFYSAGIASPFFNKLKPFESVRFWSALTEPGSIQCRFIPFSRILREYIRRGYFSVGTVGDGHRISHRVADCGPGFVHLGFNRDRSQNWRAILFWSTAQDRCGDTFGASPAGRPERHPWD